MISLQGLHVTFNAGTPIQTHVLRGLDLDIRQSEFVCIIGSNGAGKSTLLNVISGDLPVDAGRVMFGGKDVTATSTCERAAGVARVFQDPMAGTCESLTILENMALAARRGQRRVPFRSCVRSSEREFFRSRLRLLNLGLENRLDDRIGLLSGGQRQAVSLVMASLRQSGILLLDEHTAALDPKTASFVLEMTNKIVSETKLTTVMVTHSMRQALDQGNRTVMLHQGQVVLDVDGSERAGMDVADLLRAFERTRGEELDDDQMLLL